MDGGVVVGFGPIERTAPGGEGEWTGVWLWAFGPIERTARGGGGEWNSDRPFARTIQDPSLDVSHSRFPILSRVPAYRCAAGSVISISPMPPWTRASVISPVAQRTRTRVATRAVPRPKWSADPDWDR